MGRFGIGVGSERAPASGDPGVGSVLCIGRHEFPKRAELAVAAAHLLPHLSFTVVGSGGRLAWARSMKRGRTACIWASSRWPPPTSPG